MLIQDSFYLSQTPFSFHLPAHNVSSELLQEVAKGFSRRKKQHEFDDHEHRAFVQCAELILFSLTLYFMIFLINS